MKRFIYSSTSQSILSQIIKRIDYFDIVDDCSQCDLAIVNVSDDDTEYLLTVPDKVLKSLSDDEIASIIDVGVLDRLAKVCKDRLTPDQIEILTAEYKKKIPLDHEVKLKLLELFKKCHSVIIDRRQNNLSFITKHDLTIRDILSIMHNLKEDDFNANTDSIAYGYLGNNIIRFNPEIYLPYERNSIQINLCVKLALDEDRPSAAAFVSID